MRLQSFQLAVFLLTMKQSFTTHSHIKRLEQVKNGSTNNRKWIWKRLILRTISVSLANRQLTRIPVTVKKGMALLLPNRKETGYRKNKHPDLAGMMPRFQQSPAIGNPKSAHIFLTKRNKT